MDTYLAYSRLMDLNGMDDFDAFFCIMIHIDLCGIYME